MFFFHILAAGEAFAACMLQIPVKIFAAKVPKIRSSLLFFVEDRQSLARRSEARSVAANLKVAFIFCHASNFPPL